MKKKNNKYEQMLLELFDKQISLLTLTTRQRDALRVCKALEEMGKTITETHE